MFIDAEIYDGPFEKEILRGRLRVLDCFLSEPMYFQFFRLRAVIVAVQSQSLQKTAQGLPKKHGPWAWPSWGPITTITSTTYLVIIAIFSMLRVCICMYHVSRYHITM